VKPSIALYEPEIAPNCGNIIRLCVNAGCVLHLIEPLGFDLEEKKLRRAGLDYKDLAVVRVHADFQCFLSVLLHGQRLFACTTKATQSHSAPCFRHSDVFLFGPETRGLPNTVIGSIPPEQQIRIPMCPQSRSLNLSNAVAIIAYEAMRQLDFPGCG